MTKEQEQKKETRKEKAPLTEQQRQQRKKLMVYPLMVLTFIGCLWLIFAPSAKEKEDGKQGQGFNTDMPLPEDESIIGDKVKAYEQLMLEKRRKERGNMVGDLSSLWDEDAGKDSVRSKEGERRVSLQPAGGEKKATGDEGIRSSAAAYGRLNASLGTFYEQPGSDSEKEEMRRRIDELEAQVTAQENRPDAMDEQIALLEKSYELAAKYQGGNTGQVREEETASPLPERNGKAVAEPVHGVRNTVVSALAQPMSDSAFVAGYSGERNYGFHTAVGGADASEKNTITACVHGNQTVTDGQTVRLRLLEPMRVSGRIIPRNALLVGAARVQGERLDIGISSLEYDGTIIPVELAVYDTDGQSGIFIPNSQEIDAAKEIGANMGSSLGSSINISTNAGAQLASDLGKGVIQGVSQYISKKMRTVKVHLKAGYKVLLYQEID